MGNIVRLSEVYSQIPPPVLYHYTTQAGLLGILESRQIWATHTQYLNDQREYLHAIDMVRYQLAVMKYKDNPTNEIVEVLKVMTEELSGIEGMCVCVFSLSEKSDSLSQWRAYGGGSSSFAVGISQDTLMEVCKKYNFRIGKCIYEKAEQEELVTQLIDAVLNEVTKLRISDVVDWRTKAGEIMASYMNQYAPLLKHKSFSDEQEWRLISGPINPIAFDFQFRTGVSTLVPYFRISLDESDERRFSPSRVIIGPTPNLDGSVHAVRLLLARHNMMHCAHNGVVKSEVPYRSW